MYVNLKCGIALPLWRCLLQFRPWPGQRSRHLWCWRGWRVWQRTAMPTPRTQGPPLFPKQKYGSWYNTHEENKQCDWLPRTDSSRYAVTGPFPTCFLCSSISRLEFLRSSRTTPVPPPVYMEEMASRLSILKSEECSNLVWTSINLCFSIYHGYTVYDIVIFSYMIYIYIYIYIYIMYVYRVDSNVTHQPTTFIQLALATFQRYAQSSLPWVVNDDKA